MMDEVPRRCYKYRESRPLGWAKMSLRDRLIHRIEQVDGHWMWQGSVSDSSHIRKDGTRFIQKYGTITIHGKQYRAHRSSYQEFVGSIPPGLFVRHLCNIRLCINPVHLALGTNSDNMRDAVQAGTHKQTRKTQCPLGHPYDTRRYQGDRRCRMCRRAQDLVRWHKRKHLVRPRRVTV